MDNEKQYSQARTFFLNVEPVMLREESGSYPSLNSLHEQFILTDKK